MLKALYRNPLNQTPKLPKPQFNFRSTFSPTLQFPRSTIMGVGGHFWDLLKPYARTEGFDFLRNKRVAIDLSYWIVQHETAIKAYTIKPHLRLTLFRTVNLFSKFGAFPVFVVDGAPSPLKSQTRMIRFFRASGIDPSTFLGTEQGGSVERNGAFRKCVQDCVEMLELLGMPVLKAKGEAEGLCAQLNKEGDVDACITSDSDAFLFGAECVIKHVKPNTKEPFECYRMSEIEAGLGLQRNHLIAISLLVGNDYDISGVQGIGLDTALRLVKSFNEDDILHRLHEIGRGDMLQFSSSIYPAGDISPMLDENETKVKSPHCSICGHPGSKRAHVKNACEYCSSSTDTGCMQKPVGFKCNCSSCDLGRKEKEQKKNQIWQLKVCEKIAMEHNFPNYEIIDLYLNNSHCDFDGPNLSWESPKVEMLVEYLTYHLHWEPSFTRQRLLPMLSTIFLREMASNPTNDLLYGQYEFDSIQRVKIRFGHQYYVVNWKKAARSMDNTIYKIPSEEPEPEPEPEPESESLREAEESIDMSDEPDVTVVQVDNRCFFLLTDEDMELVRAAFPEKVDQFLREKELKEMKSRRKKSSQKSVVTPENSGVKSTSIQLNITEFYRSSKVQSQEKAAENINENSGKVYGSPNGKRNSSNSNLSKSVRRRLLFG